MWSVLGALTAFAHRDDVDVVWHAFELDPGAPPVVEGDPVAHLARKYGRSVGEARSMIEHVIDVAAKDGLDLQLFWGRLLLPQCRQIAAAATMTTRRSKRLPAAWVADSPAMCARTKAARD